VVGSWILWRWPWKCSDFTHILIRDSRCCEQRKECVRILLLLTAFCCKQKIEAVAGRCSIDNVYQKTGAPQLEIPVSDKSACDSDTLTEDQEYMKEIKEPHAYLDMVYFLPSGNLEFLLCSAICSLQQYITCTKIEPTDFFHRISVVILIQLAGILIIEWLMFF